MRERAFLHRLDAKPRDYGAPVCRRSDLKNVRACFFTPSEIGNMTLSGKPRGNLIRSSARGAASTRDCMRSHSVEPPTRPASACQCRG